ncbi:hypothetical protein [Scytonema sp. NUACC21]
MSNFPESNLPQSLPSTSQIHQAAIGDKNQLIRTMSGGREIAYVENLKQFIQNPPRALSLHQLLAIS